MPSGRLNQQQPGPPPHQQHSPNPPTHPTPRPSPGAYLLGVMPPELISTLGIDIPTIRRDPHYFLPTTGEK
jgi:hypothetical protein